MKALDFVADATKRYIEQMPKAQRKKYGQFFTSKETAAFMAELFEISCLDSSISVLDPGAGTGILTAAMIDRLEQHPNFKTINLVCYENDPDVRKILEQNLGWIKERSEKKSYMKYGLKIIF